MKNKILLTVSVVSLVLGNIAIASSNPTDSTEKLPEPPPTNVDRALDSSTNSNTPNTDNMEVKSKVAFVCESKEDLLLTVAKIEGQEDIQILDWDAEHFSDRVKAAEVCDKAATKLQVYYDSGKLNNISFASGKIEDVPLLCIQEVKEGQTLNGRSSGCIDTDEVLVTLDSSQKAGKVLCDVIVDEKQKPASCNITHRGDFPLRFRFSWLPF